MNAVDTAPSSRHQRIWTNESEVNYPRNCWWVAAFVGEVTREPVARWLLDRPVVLYRKEDGKVVALDNRCPHRWAPLSGGKVIGDEIQCPYHGLQFSAQGQCVKVPTQAAIPLNSSIHAYPVIEANPFVWIWMGDPARIGEFDPPVDTSWINNVVNPYHGVMEVNCNYMMLHDNVMDLTHFGFVHANSLQSDDWKTPAKMTATANTVTCRQDFPEYLVTPAHTAVTGIPPGKVVSSVRESGWKSPALHAGGEHICDPAPEPGRRGEFKFYVAHAPTPMSMNKMRYHFVLGWDIEMPAGASLGDGVNVIFDEDKRILEMIQEGIERDGRGRDFPEAMLKADTAQLRARRMLKDLMDRQ